MEKLDINRECEQRINPTKIDRSEESETIMSRSRRPSISIYDYPEHLNPFNDDGSSIQPRSIHEETKSSDKDSRHKFWSFGRNKKRSNSFSIKSTWNGLFGKRKGKPGLDERRTTITTVSSSYPKRLERPIVPPRMSRDQQEFDEALGTLTRRRKCTLDTASKFGSNLTVNGDPARIYNGSPKDTTASIMGDLTPKPPARRFGQVSSRPTDKIPTLEFEDKEQKDNDIDAIEDKALDQTPIPPKRFGQRASQRLNTTLDSEEEILEKTQKSSGLFLRDENENVPDDYVFKRFNQDAVRMSNLSINSCISIGSTASNIGRKKRRAPQPPRQKESLESPEENGVQSTTIVAKTELPTIEPVDIAIVTENIDVMTKQSQNIGEASSTVLDSKNDIDSCEDDNEDDAIVNLVDKERRVVESSDRSETANLKSSDNEAEDTTSSEEIVTGKVVEVIKDVNCEINNASSDFNEQSVRRKDSSGALSRSDSFSVKEEIEKIEKQIKALEARDARRDSVVDGLKNYDPSDTRLSIQEDRRNFFRNMMMRDDSCGIRVELKKLPREQNDIRVVKVTDLPVPMNATKESVKIVELHISEPIKLVPEFIGDTDVNPLPKPRRHSALNVRRDSLGDDCKKLDVEDKRGNSL